MYSYVNTEWQRSSHEDQRLYGIGGYIHETYVAYHIFYQLSKIKDVLIEFLFYTIFNIRWVFTMSIHSNLALYSTIRYICIDIEYLYIIITSDEANVLHSLIARSKVSRIFFIFSVIVSGMARRPAEMGPGGSRRCEGSATAGGQTLAARRRVD